MIHYHGTPITPDEQARRLAGRSFCVSFAAPRQAALCHEIGEGVMLDNGAFTFWKQNVAVDWDAFYVWAERWLGFQTTWAVIPDVIGGTLGENERLIEAWPFGLRGAPVWHLHEPLARLRRLCREWPRVCFGSSAEYAKIADRRWHCRVHDAFDAIAGDGGRIDNWIHMLRGLSQAGTPYPFASADSTNVARNFKGTTYHWSKDIVEMAAEIDARQCPATWEPFHPAALDVRAARRRPVHPRGGVWCQLTPEEAMRRAA